MIVVLSSLSKKPGLIPEHVRFLRSESHALRGAEGHSPGTSQRNTKHLRNRLETVQERSVPRLSCLGPCLCPLQDLADTNVAVQPAAVDESVQGMHPALQNVGGMPFAV